MSGRASRDKGARGKRELVRMLQAAGSAAKRVPLSDAAGGRYVGDVSLPLLGRDHIVEAKVRRDGFKELYRWLAADLDLLVIRADRREPLVVLPLRLAVEIAMAAEKSRGRS